MWYLVHVLFLLEDQLTRCPKQQRTCFTHKCCYYLANQSFMNFASLCHLHIAEELLKGSVISCPHLWSYSCFRYRFIPDEENLRCFIWLCSTSISGSKGGCIVHCMSAAITSRYHILQYVPVSLRSCFSHVFLCPFFTFFSDPYPWPSAPRFSDVVSFWICSRLLLFQLIRFMISRFLNDRHKFVLNP